jgi:hypothetical protein
MNRILLPADQIPLHYLYFGWKKAKSFVKQLGFYDPIELKEFELELEKNLIDLQTELISLKYIMAKPIIYGFPKGANGDELKLRPMSKILFKDQVAWATVVLLLGESFDTNDHVNFVKPDEPLEGISWMVDWSSNNRLRRKYYPVEKENVTHFHRLMINYTHNDLYESFQRSLRLQRKKQEVYFNKVLEKSSFAYYGQADIAKFFPSLKMSVVLDVLKKRLSQLVKLNAITLDEAKKWAKLLKGMCTIHSDISYLRSEEKKSIGLDYDDYTNLETLPTGLISSGFLSNCVLTHCLDIPMEKFMSNKREEGSSIYLTRYTDDMMIIALNEESVIEGLLKIQKLLSQIGLKLSDDKTKPKLRENIEKKVKDDIKDLNPGQVELVLNLFYKDEIICPRIGKYDALPSSTSLIDKLSQLGEQQVRAMRGDELNKYLSELMDLVKTEFADAEIRGDTKSSFAAWRIRKAANDIRYRELKTENDVTDTLKRSFMKYPFKMSLVDCYILHLLEIQFNSKTESLFIEMFQSAKKSISNTQPGFFGSYIRTRIMLCIAENWSLVKEDDRSRVREIILTQTLEWYKEIEDPTWHEQYAIYWLYTNSNIQTDPEIIKSDSIDIVTRSYQLFELMKKTVSVGRDPVLVAVMSEIWKRNRPRGKYEGLQLEEAEWINWSWKMLSRKRNSWLWRKENHSRVWLELVSGREEAISEYGLLRIIEIANDQLYFLNKDEYALGEHEDWDSLEVIPSYHGLIDTLNRIITICTESPMCELSIRLLSVLESLPEVNRIGQYLIVRLTNLENIAREFFGSDGMNSLPVINNNNESEGIPLTEWLEIIRILPRHVEINDIPKEMLSLTEAEITQLLIKIGEAFQPIINEPINILEQLFNKKANLAKLSINRISFTIKDWTEWRNSNYDPNFSFCEEHIVFAGSYISSWAYTNVLFADEEYLLCHAFSMLLLRLISNKDIRTKGPGIAGLKGWSKISDVVAQAGFPSTTLAELIVGSLNYQRPFYESTYSESSARLPLLPLEKRPITKVIEFIEKLREHLELLNQRFFIGDTGLRELRFIDIDKLVKE